MAKSNQINLNDLFELKIKALYDIENQLVKALPKMAKKSTDEDLKMAFEQHLMETQEQVRRLESIFGFLEIKPQKTKVEAIRGLTKDAEWLIKNIKTEALNAALISAGQYVEHYEIAGYGTAIEWAKLLGLPKAADLLEQTLEEEKSADEKLSSLATSKINQLAENPGATSIIMPHRKNVFGT